MTTAMSKRNQARNEKALQDLIRNVPGNDRCADCSARNPGWASWSLGIFLCMRCAAIHRKLGTHISKVKSLSMDSWTNEQVESMQKMGNVNSNKIWNPNNKQPNVPLDVDEVDGVVERFIRQKYEHKAFSAGRAPAPQSSGVQSSSAGASWNPQLPSRSRDAHDTPDSRGSREQSPPPPPPKSGKKFGFGLRAASSTFHLGKPKGRERKASLPTGRVVGATIGIREDELGLKLVTLKEMGFRDEKRNTEILKGLNGDLERTIESLVRLGQGPADDLELKKQISKNFDRDPNRFPQPPERSSSKPLPPQPQSAGIMGAGLRQSPQTTGISVARSSASSPGHRKQSNNPFDGVANAQPPQAAFEQAFSSMSISTPLSTQSTGILPSQQPAHQTIYQQSMTPPPTGGFQQPAYNPYLQQQQQQQQQQQVQQGAYYGNQPAQYAQATYQQPLQQQATGHNPFMQAQVQTPTNFASPQSYQASPNPFIQAQQQQQQQPLQSPNNPFVQQMNMGAHTANYQTQHPQHASDQFFSQSPSQYQPASNQGQQNPFLQQTLNPAPQQQQYQQQQYQQPLLQQQQQFFQQPQQQFQAQQQFQPQQFQQPFPQPLAAQPTGRLNKHNIMALYAQAPLQPSIPEDQVATTPPPMSASPAPTGSQTLAPANLAANRRSMTMPVMSTGTNNPFGAAPQAQPQMQVQAQPGARVRDSIFMDGASDPFAGLSARFV